MHFSDESVQQRRRHRRRSVELKARVRFEMREMSAVAENISPGGAFLRVALPEDAQRLVALIDLPHGKRLLVEARICWRHPDGVGVQFESFPR